MGASNIILEGISDQKVLVSAIQRFSDPTRIDDMLDLNRATFVSASGIYDVERLIRSTAGSKEKRPVAVVLVDGDADGQIVVQKLVASDIIQKDFVCTLADLQLSCSWNEAPKTLDDLVPPSFLSYAVTLYAHAAWNTSLEREKMETKLTDNTSTNPMSDRLVQVLRETLGNDVARVSDIELRSGVFDHLATLMGSADDFAADAALQATLKEFEQVIRKICHQVRLMLRAAETTSRRDRLQKNVRIEIEAFRKTHRAQATKADIERCLLKLEAVCVGPSDNVRVAKDNVRSLMQYLDAEVRNAGDRVDIDVWALRLQELWEGNVYLTNHRK